MISLTEKKKMKTFILGIISAIIIFIGFQMIVPFPYGLVLGIVFAVLIIRYAIKNASIGK